MSKKELIDEMNALYREQYPLVKEYFRIQSRLDKELEKPKPHSPATKDKIAKLKKELDSADKKTKPIEKEIKRLQVEFFRLVNQKLSKYLSERLPKNWIS